MKFSSAFDRETNARVYVQTVHEMHGMFGLASTPHVLRNPLNGSGGTSRGARMAANARRRNERQVGARLARRLQGADPSHTWIVVLTRVSPRPFDDDGLRASLKSIRDGIASEWGIDDGPSGPVVWLYDWRKGAPKQHAVEVGLWVWRKESAAAPGPRLSLWSAVTPKRLDVRFVPNVVKSGGGR